MNIEKSGFIDFSGESHKEEEAMIYEGLSANGSCRIILDIHIEKASCTDNQESDDKNIDPLKDFRFYPKKPRVDSFLILI